MKVVAAVLAAGAGSRYSGPTHKLLAPFCSSTVVQYAVAAAVEAAVGPVVVIAGAVDLPATAGAEVVVNPRWIEGQATSVQTAIAAASDKGADAVLIGLGDQPLVPADAWRSVATAAGGPIVVSTYDGRRSLPVRLDREVWPLIPQSGDEGARLVMRSHPELVTEVAVVGNPLDVDTAEDLDRWS